ncbi:MAG: hypothetical protein A2504_04625 [Bdellovibrionales bacterium RIFOXYD12_FULL_39_22]|nr:MAG: hypothetical protein A2385_07200 [Bdellovibrionales bacterium RIFOXYB1_FULL_39_21]OFZ42048.1 MAG: hypothetical protein A2485_09170 [Bdellovibrionales bacterium RIFOXYC12_FULL_39_17]OFZ50764.1 MAG: hypothetical protein A2404_06120 [Bdellovibrionales bacterium RIFOXYC1_FULL_39_130]OFZ73504.1 MAG: hypothetical protein A2451_04785 [Bdellovibrionales bacterium RIFOXYC2_FULL_39_8]OFZ77987.1 MAG: hypothetical protein A2560_01290 [Bdellovibrionales bacterium RIFOXYD1_FULL_39_84]OFZ93577.1 MAG:
MSHVLVIEDEKDVAFLISTRLKREGHEVVIATNGQDGLEFVKKKILSFDLIILDWMLPGLSGLDVLKKLGRQIPVLMVTARASSQDVVLGLEMGADDYLTKPFDVHVLIARVNALLRRASKNSSSDKKLKIEGLTLDIERHEVFCKDVPIDLTPSEFRLLVAMMQNAGRVLSRDRLMDLVQGDTNVTDRTIDTHIFGLRKKLQSCQDVIETIRGIGYRVRG